MSTRREDERGAADLATAAERGDADVLVVGHLLAVNLAADAFEDVPPLLAFLLEEVPDVLDRRGLDGRSPDDLGRPADLLCDLPERRTVPSDDHPRFLGLDDHLARVGVEIEVGHAGRFGDDREYLFACRGRVREHRRVRADGDALSQLGGEPADEVTVPCEGLGVSRVDDQFRPLVGHLRDGDVTGNLVRNLFSHLLELLVYRTHGLEACAVSPWWRAAPERYVADRLWRVVRPVIVWVCISRVVRELRTLNVRVRKTDLYGPVFPAQYKSASQRRHVLRPNPAPGKH